MRKCTLYRGNEHYKQYSFVQILNEYNMSIFVSEFCTNKTLFNQRESISFVIIVLHTDSYYALRFGYRYLLAYNMPFVP